MTGKEDEDEKRKEQLSSREAKTMDEIKKDSKNKMRTNVLIFSEIMFDIIHPSLRGGLLPDLRALDNLSTKSADAGKAHRLYQFPASRWQADLPM